MQLYNALVTFQRQFIGVVFCLYFSAARTWFVLVLFAYFEFLVMINSEKTLSCFTEQGNFINQVIHTVIIVEYVCCVC